MKSRVLHVGGLTGRHCSKKALQWTTQIQVAACSPLLEAAGGGKTRRDQQPQIDKKSELLSLARYMSNDLITMHWHGCLESQGEVHKRWLAVPENIPEIQAVCAVLIWQKSIQLASVTIARFTLSASCSHKTTSIELYRYIDSKSVCRQKKYTGYILQQLITTSWL